MADREDVCVLIPTLNEAETIGEVIDGFTSRGFDNVLVADGNSTDDTQAVAKEHGARVVTQTGTGKGQAVREALDYIDAEYVLMLDGDGTYRAEDADAMLEPLLAGSAEHVIGDRFADMEDGAMTKLNQWGNAMFNWVFRHIHGKNFQDILSGYRAFTRESVENFYLDADGFGVETEMAVECVKQGVPTTVVPIRYEARPDDSDTNLHPIHDGGVILLTLYQLAKTNNPLFYFGSIGVMSSLFGVGLGAYVGIEWVTQRISHEVLAVVAAFAILFGVQLLMFGVLSDMIVTLHREQMRRMD
ncbi:S-layer glycoprotein N-glycosyltransferase AglJ [Halorussus halophilus]|uniref:S-layer glycoprotein N-glycosyltransferase AglJ n=1 Tax=Halorussus halophilus TaxID=2650975 RepID=UPI0013010513|nr:S-layer glycoprotein N-glycosyltransferase AglJ [Halorussus halophilus]